MDAICCCEALKSVGTPGEKSVPSEYVKAGELTLFILAWPIELDNIVLPESDCPIQDEDGCPISPLTLIETELTPSFPFAENEQT